MSGVEVIDALLSRISTVDEIADEAVQIAKDLCIAETSLIYASGAEEIKAAKAEVLRLKSLEKQNRIRAKQNSKLASMLQTISRVGR